MIWTTTPWTLAGEPRDRGPSRRSTTSPCDAGRAGARSSREALVDGVPPLCPASTSRRHRRCASRCRARARGPRGPASVDRPRLAGRAAATTSTLDAGTGLVHTAPGPRRGRLRGRPDATASRSTPRSTTHGRFTDEVGALRGAQRCSTRTRGSSSTSRARGALIARASRSQHTYPHCWRCKNPIIFRATEQWFIAMDRDGLRAAGARRDRATCSGSRAWGDERIHDMIENRPDWCISRQRVWGVPIVAFYCTGCGDAAARRGRSSSTSPRSSRRSAAPTPGSCARRPSCCRRAPGVAKCGGERASARRPTSSTSGSTPAAATRRCSSSAPSCAGPPTSTSRAPTSIAAGSTPRCSRRSGTRDRPPYRAVLTHGFVVDGDGRKMSKSGGNDISPDELIPKYGAEILRLWVAAEDYRRTSASRTRSSNRLAEAYRRIRNTSRFLLGNLDDFDPERDRRSYDQMHELDRWALLRLGDLIARVRERTTTTSSTSSSTRSTTSARSTSPRSTSTSSRTGSTPRLPTTRAAARPRRCASSCSPP